jgi:REP element-mobilizing transposase RayT
LSRRGLPGGITDGPGLILVRFVRRNGIIILATLTMAGCSYRLLEFWLMYSGTKYAIMPQKVELGTFVVMPNHIHGILILTNDDGNNANANVETRHALSLPPTPPQPSSQRFQNQGKNTVSSIIGGYKSAVTKHAHRLGLEVGWQARFHDHIIRNDAEYQRINDYIEQNPEGWYADKFCTEIPDHEPRPTSV